MKYFGCSESPLELFGVEVVEPEKQIFWRLPDDETSLVSANVRDRSKSACGGRIRFRTDAEKIEIKLSLHTLGVDICIPLPGSAGVDVYTGSGMLSKYRGYASPLNYEEKSITKEIPLIFSGEDKRIQQVTINLPRNERLAGITIGFPDDAEVLSPEPYSCSERICYYGSSITEGGCHSRPGNAYTSIVSRWFDCDYANYGFSGMARGELAMADIIGKRDFSILVYDYDHNAPDAAHLQATHEPFFKRIREHKPDMPVIMMSMPDFDSNPVGNSVRRDIIYNTYVNARRSGDKNVYFIDGEAFFGAVGRDTCTIDNCHPNDLGFYRMAERVYAVLAKIIK